jgi:hypothetical protein
MAGKTDALKERYERFSRGELERALDLWTDDFLWDGDGTGLPGSGRYEGKPAAIGALQEAVGAWDTFELTADEFFENGDTVVVIGRTTMTKGNRSGTIPVAHIWRYRGEQVCSLQVLQNTLEIAKLLGVS